MPLQTSSKRKEKLNIKALLRAQRRKHHQYEEDRDQEKLKQLLKKLKKGKEERKLVNGADKDIEQYKTNKKVSAPPIVNKVINYIKNHNYRVYGKGGYIRDLLYGLVPNDYDLIAECSPEDIKKIFKDQCTIIRFVKGLCVIGTNIQVYCVPKLNLKEQASTADATVNGLFATEDGTVLDPNGYLPDLDSAEIKVPGDPHERFAEDPKRVYRVCNVCSRLEKDINSDLEHDIMECAPLITTISMGSYFTLMRSLFFRGNALANLDLIAPLGILYDLMPAKELLQDESFFQYADNIIYWNCAWDDIDKTNPVIHTNLELATKVLAILLLPKLAWLCALEGKDLEENIESLIEIYCSAYRGDFPGKEKIAFKEILKPQMLEIFMNYKQSQARLLLAQPCFTPMYHHQPVLTPLHEEVPTQPRSQIFERP